MINITEEQQKLVNDNHNLIYSFLTKYHLDVEEHYDLAAIGMCKAAIRFDRAKANSFSTFAYQCMLHQVLMEKRKERAKHSIPKENILYYQQEYEKDNDNRTFSFLDVICSNDDVESEAVSTVILEDYLKKAKQRDRKIVALLQLGYTQREIAKILGCSQPEVSRAKLRLSDYLIK